MFKLVGLIGDARLDVLLWCNLLNMSPVKLHINSFALFLFDSVVKDAISRAVVGTDRCWRLWIFKFFAGNADWEDGFCIEEEGCNFGFCCR